MGWGVSSPRTVAPTPKGVGTGLRQDPPKPACASCHPLAGHKSCSAGADPLPKPFSASLNTSSPPFPFTSPEGYGMERITMGMKLPWMVVGIGLVVGHLLISLVFAQSPSASPPPQAPDAAIRGVKMMETRKGERQWEVEADKADVLEDRGVAVLGKVVRPVRIVIYSGDETLVSFAEKVIVDLKTKDLQLIGHVQAESNKGTRIFTEVLHWSATQRKLTTDEPVVMEKEGFQIKGKGMVADSNLERMTFRERIVSEVKLSPTKGRR